MKKYFELTKFGIVTFVIFTAAGGYLIGQPFINDLSISELLITLLGLYFLSSGSFALNQYQEREIDKKMPRTRKRPIPSGRVEPHKALIFANVMMAIGVALNLYISWRVAVLGLTTVFFYNYLYTLKWKRTSPFAAVPGSLHRTAYTRQD